MHVVTNRVRHGEREYTSTLLRRSYRESGKVRKETLANLSHLPPELIELIRGAVAGHPLAARRGCLHDRALPARRTRGRDLDDGAPAGARRAVGRQALARARSGVGDDLPAGDRADVYYAGSLIGRGLV